MANFNTSGSGSGSKLSIYYQNVRGLRTKCLTLYNNILSSEYDVLCFTETWLQDDILDTEICDSRYSVFRCDRDLISTNRSTGGGVMVCVRRDLCASLRLEWSCDLIESVCVCVPGRRLGSNSHLNIILLYLPPDYNLIETRLQGVLDSFLRFYNLNPADNYLFLGDFNLNFIQWSSDMYSIQSGSISLQNVTLKFIDELHYLGFSQYNLEVNCCNNILDLCFSNSELTVNSTLPLSKKDKFHPPLEINFVNLHFKHLKENPQPHFNFFKGDYDSINKYFNEIDWTTTLGVGTVDEAVDAFYDKIYACCSLFVPVSTRNTCYPIWYSASLIKIIREKYKFHKKWKRTNNPRDRDTFSLLRARQHRVQNQCFKLFTENTEKLIKATPKIFWKYVKSKRNGSHYPHCFTLGDREYNDGHNICNAFNEFFDSVFVRTMSSSNSFHMDNTPVSNNAVLTSIDINVETVRRMLSCLDKSKGPGSDRVPPIFLAQCAESLAQPVSILFRRSLKECVFPVTWKKAHIIPIHKKGPKTKIENYRPISILNSVAKLFEKLVYNSMYTIISNGISAKQHGFLKGRSTISNLACFTDYVLSNMARGSQVDVVYTDFEKAFDRVNHFILLRKLYVLGIHGDLLRWVTSYLHNRSQCVVVGGYRSDFITIPSGVPQGSHLGPLFYNAYLFDINSCFSHANHLLYADDKKIYLSIKSLDDCELLQSDLNNLYNYYLKNNISISIHKCQCISFTRKHSPIEYQYHFNGVVVERTELVRDLGILLDSKMTMTNHIDYVTNRAFRSLGFCMRTCHPFTNILSFKIVYYAYVRSILEYASSIWSPQYAIHINRLERLQRKFMGYLNFKFKNQSASYIENCRLFKLLTLEERRYLTDMGLLFDILRGRLDCPDLLSSICFSAPMRRTRHARLFAPPFHSTSYGQNAVLTRLTRTYNNKFDATDPFIGTKSSFKQKIKAIILN